MVAQFAFAQPSMYGYDEDHDDDAKSALIADPLEPFNRAMFKLNDRVYFYVLKPVVRVYRHVPQPARVSVSNFFHNLRAPIRIANCLLQLKLVDAGNELLRFGVNTTFGVAGLFDPARSRLQIRPTDEDLGQTLGRYGVGQGFYVVLPFFGSTTLRDGSAGVVDSIYLDPAVVYVDDPWVSTGIVFYENINSFSLDRDTYETVKREALDPYAFVRDAYVQQRQAKVEDR
jgi:phospholipid-binding lipoprotein MlaA